MAAVAAAAAMVSDSGGASLPGGRYSLLAVEGEEEGEEEEFEEEEVEDSDSDRPLPNHSPFLRTRKYHSISASSEFVEQSERERAQPIVLAQQSSTSKLLHRDRRLLLHPCRLLLHNNLGNDRRDPRLVHHPLERFERIMRIVPAPSISFYSSQMTTELTPRYAASASAPRASDSTSRVESAYSPRSSHCTSSAYRRRSLHSPCASPATLERTKRYRTLVVGESVGRSERRGR